MFAVYVGTGGTVVEYAYTDTDFDPTRSGSVDYVYFDAWKFTSLSFGAADSTRRIVVVVTWTHSSGTRTIKEATIGGIAATIHRNYSPATGRGIGIISAEVPTGTTGTVIVNLTGNSGIGGSCGISVYRLLNCTSSNGNETSTSPTTVSVGYGDVVISGAYFDSASGTVSWTGATEDAETDQDGSSARHCAASYSATAIDATYDTEVSISGSGSLAMASQVFTAN